MFQVRHFVVLNCALALTMSAAFAGTKPGDGKNGKPGKPISWEELKDRCMHPEQFDVQRPPQNIKVECTDTQTSWTAAAAGEVDLPNHRKITTRVAADKFYVDENCEEFDVPSKGGSCQRFKEIEQSITIELPVNCDQVLGWKGTLGEYCAAETDKSKGANPKLVQTVDTGRVIDTCGGLGQNKPGNGKGKQK